MCGAVQQHIGVAGAPLPAPAAQREARKLADPGAGAVEDQFLRLDRDAVAGGKIACQQDRILADALRRRAVLPGD